VNDSPHDPIGFQLAELLREHLLRDPRYRALQVGEAQNLAAEQMEQDQQLPPPFDELERLLDAVRRHGITEHELQRAKNQLRARLVFEGDSISNIAHQLGYFETIASWRLVPALRERIDGVTVEQVGEAAAACFRTANRTIGWFDPQPPADEPPAPIGEGAGAGPAARERR